MDLPNTGHNNAGTWDGADGQGEDCCMPKESELGLPQCFWDDGNQYEDSVLYMLGDHTPIKDCGTFNLDDPDLGDKTCKDLEKTECRSSQVKRRRMLQFTSDVHDNPPGDQQPASACNTLVQEESTIPGLPESSSWDSLLCSDFRDICDLFSNEVLDPSSDEWIQNYFNEGEIHEGTSETSSTMTDYASVDYQTDYSNASEVYNVAVSEKTNNVVLKTTNAKTSFLKIIKGRQSFTTSGTKLTTSVACPFTLIKPFEVQGKLTLKDINQRIDTPAPRPKLTKKDDNSYLSYPTSAFSGKPVVAKTKIRTDRGTGCITIVRTKG